MAVYYAVFGGEYSWLEVREARAALEGLRRPVLEGGGGDLVGVGEHHDEAALAVARQDVRGPQLALELAARDPELFAGAVSLCPGGRRGMQLAEIVERPDLSRGMYLVVSGELEGERAHALADADRRWIEAAGGHVVRHTYPGLGHSFPPSYYNSLAMWIQFLLPPQGDG